MLNQSSVSRQGSQGNPGDSFLVAAVFVFVNFIGNNVCLVDRGRKGRGSGVVRPLFIHFLLVLRMYSGEGGTRNFGYKVKCYFKRAIHNLLILNKVHQASQRLHHPED